MIAWPWRKPASHATESGCTDWITVPASPASIPMWMSPASATEIAYTAMTVAPIASAARGQEASLTGGPP